MRGDMRCVGAIGTKGEPVRHLTAGGQNWPQAAPFDVGHVWEVECKASQNIVRPHVEDVLVSSQKFIKAYSEVQVRDLLLKPMKHRSTWKGSIRVMFGGLCRFTRHHNAYICDAGGVPKNSTGFWIPDGELRLREDRKHYDYFAPESRDATSDRLGLSYVGEREPLRVLPEGTLIRVSLARWWKPPDFDELRCYAQLSGWY